MNRCRCINHVNIYNIGDIYDYDYYNDVDSRTRSSYINLFLWIRIKESKELGWVITKHEFDKWFVDIAEDRDKKITEVLGE